MIVQKGRVKGMKKFHMEAQCYLCKKKFSSMEGTDAYQRIKVNKKGLHCCESCKEKIELEARLQLGRRLLYGRD